MRCKHIHFLIKLVFGLRIEIQSSGRVGFSLGFSNPIRIADFYLTKRRTPTNLARSRRASHNPEITKILVFSRFLGNIQLYPLNKSLSGAA
jgi:hypothetical protein